MNMRENVSASTLQASISRSDWVDMQLIGVFMRDAVLPLYVTLGVTVVVSAMLFPNIPLLQICLWAFAQTALVCARHWVIRTYRRDFRDVSGDSLVASEKRANNLA